MSRLELKDAIAASAVEGMAKMQRRTFLQSLAAMAAGGFLNGIVGASEQAGVEIDYELFCDDCGISRYRVSAPWSWEGQVYATDLRCLIAHPGELSGVGDGRLPPVDRLCWEEFDAPGWLALPDRPQLSRSEAVDLWQPCNACLGRGRTGKGVRRNPAAGDFAEGAARRMGGVVCHECRGTGESADGDSPLCERLAGAPFSIGYMQRLRTLGPLEYRVLPYGYKAEGIEIPEGVMIFRGGNELKGFLCGLQE